MGTGTAFRDPTRSPVRSRNPAPIPNAEPMVGLRGTPLGVPVVPDVRMTIRPDAATLGRGPRWCRVDRRWVDDGNGLVGVMHAIQEFVVTDHGPDPVRA